jgi:hypothetical protein
METFNINKYKFMIKWEEEKMSAFVLNRNYELQLPSSFVDVDCEEMEYVDGGGFISYNQLVDKLLQFGAVSAMVIYRYGFNAIVTAVQAGIAIAKRALLALGVAGAIIGAYVGWKAASFVTEVAQALDQRKGLEYGFGWSGPYLYCQ